MNLWVNKSQDNYLKIKKTHIEFGAPVFPENVFPENEFNVLGIGVKPSKIEILTHIDGLTFDESMKKCNFLKLEKINVPYINFNDLIKNKLSSGRFKDLADIEQLNKLKKNNND